MKLNKKLFGRSLYKIATILFLVGYNFAPAVFAIGDIPKLEVKQDQSVSVTTEETSEVLNEVPVDTSEDIIKGGGVSTSRNLSTSKNAIRSGEYTVGATSGKWTGTNNNWIVYGLDTNHISWGNTNSNSRSGLEFIGSNAQSFNEGQEFELGTLKHINKPIWGSAITQAKLVVKVDLSNPNLDPKEFTFNMKINETPNSGVCEAWHTEGKPPCDDMITFPTSFSNETFTMNGKKYLLEITGFIKDGVQVNQFITHENETNTAVIKAKLTSLPEKVTICHANSSDTNQYVVNTPDANGSVGGHNEHNGPVWYPGITVTWGDIIPQFYYFDTAGNVISYPGKNNTAYGLSILENGCNFPKGKITVNKVVVPAGESDSFTVTGSGTPSVADYPVGKPTFIDSNVGTISENSPAIFNVYPGTYSFTETEKDGWVETENTCNDIVVANNYEKSCTITNTKASKLTIIKHAEQPGDTSFGFTATGTGLSNFSLTDNSASTDPEKVFTKLLPGEYSVTENPKDGWYLKSATCDNGQTPDKLNLTAGSDVTCTFTNTKYGSITIVKDARPSSDQVFSFTTEGTGLSNFTLIDNYDDSNPSKVFENLLPGTYSVTEDNASGWDLTSATCSDESDVTEINLPAGENITCTFVNVKRGSISGHKYYDEDGKAETTNDRHPVQGWTIFIDANNNEVLDDGEASKITGADGKYTFSNIKPGTYKIVEVMRLGWIELTGLTQTITLLSGENRENVDFVNVEYPTIQVIKNVDTDGDGVVDVTNATDWTWKIDTDEYTTGIKAVEKMPGKYTISEVQKENYHVTSLVCIKGEAEIYNNVSESAEIELKSGDKVVCTFTNTRDTGSIVIKKLVEPNTDESTFTFSGDVTGTIGHNGVISKKVVSGKYSVSELVPTGWNLKSIACDDTDSTGDGNTATINVSENETVTCTFTNEKLGKISGYKYEDKNGNGTWDSGEVALSGWTINNGLGGTTTTNASGYYEFINLPVGNTYTITEVDQEGWKQTSTNPDSITIVAGSDVKNVNFGNFENVTISVTKDVVGIDGVTDVTDSTEFKSLLNDADAKTIAEGTTATYTVIDPGAYSVTESVNTDYDYIGCFLDDDAFSNYSVESGQTYNVVCKNKQKPATLIVNKSVIDSENNDDGVFSEDEFDVVLGEETKQIADKEGGKVKAEFGGLQPGDYTFTETPKDGYIFDGCTNDGEVTLGSNKTVEVTLGSNKTVEVTCTNRVIDPILQIEKSNNKTGIDQYAGNEVTYTIKVTAPKDESEGTYVLNDVVVSDIAPAGFDYIKGTWTAKKNGVDMEIPKPTYNGTDRAQWKLGQMVEEDKIVLTYKTQISLQTDPGVYPDIAWVKGVSLSGTNVLGNVSTVADTPFVGTEVKVIEDDIVEGGEVLGASISLPNTGANTYLTLGALIMMIIGAISLLFKPFKKFKYALLSALIAISFVTLITPNTVLAADSDIQVKIMKPETPTNKKSFNVGFVVLDLNNNPVTVECFKDAEVVPFETHTPANAGNCAVTIAASGTYTFYVKATSDSGTRKTAPVTVEVNLDKPSPVIDYSKAGNVLKFKTANDGKTAKVEIHRSEKPSYTVNKDTKIHTMNVAPNTAYSWTDASAEPGKTYYYALRSLDAFGNVSTMVSDPEVKVTQEATTTTPSATGTAVAGTETKTEGEVKGDTDEGTIMDTEEVKEGKEKVQPEKEGEEKEVELTPNYKKYWYIWVPAILLVLGVGYIYVKRSKEE